MPAHSAIRYKNALLTGTALALAMFGPINGADAKSSDSVLYSFQGGSDGIYPQGALFRDSAGNVYGTTYQGGIPGANGYGTVFKLAPDGTETVLHAFAGKPGDGANPNAGFIADKQGNLYSTTINDGANTGGAVFEIAADGTETLLYSFCAQENCADGRTPYGGVIADKKGNLYGTTYEGGTNDYGTVFKLAPDGTETVLHAFTGGSDGSYPDAGLIMKDGNLYGTTYDGGGGSSSGTVFEVAADGTETVLHSFDGADGGNPADGLIEDSVGDFYGTTVAGGAKGFGIVFKLAPDGTETVLHAFKDGSDGAVPYGGLIVKGGHLYGTTSEGGGGGSNCANSAGCGTVFEVKE
jgi:uncharacterized repeat protein (TIGR03803 family)